MGYRNADRVFANWAHLGHRSHRLLTWMALQAKDSETPEYYGGAEACAAALGAGAQSVKEAMADLRSNGAVALAKHSAPGSRARWVLNLGPNRVVNSYPVEGSNRVVKDTPVTTNRVVKSTPVQGSEIHPCSPEQGSDFHLTGVPSTTPNKKTEVLTSPTSVVREVRAQRATRLPEGWLPTKELADQMRAECPGVDLKFEHAKFTDHFRSAPDAKARKVDWPATWRNWIRRAYSDLPAVRRAATPPQPRMATTDQRVQAAADLAAHYRAAETPNQLAIPGGAA